MRKIFLFVLAMTVTAIAQDQEIPSVSGIVFSDGIGYASIRVGESRAAWVREGEHVGPYFVIRLGQDAKSVTLLKSDGTEIEIHLSAPAIMATDVNIGLIPLESLDWEWVRSARNPMEKYAPNLPMDVIMQWGNMTDEERMAFINHYRRHGWELTVILGPEIRITRAPLYDPRNPRVIRPENIRAAGPKDMLIPTFK